MAYACTHFACYQLAYVSLWVAYLAQVNPGIICVLWLTNPITMAIADLYIYGQRSKLYHIIGILSIVVCGSLISFAKNQNEAEILGDEPALPVWAAVLVGALTGCFYTVHQLFTKHLCQPRIGFNAELLTFASYFQSSIIVSLVSIPWFQNNGVKVELFYYGLGIIVVSIGSVCMSLGIAGPNKGPAGPAMALASLDGAIYAVIYAMLY